MLFLKCVLISFFLTLALSQVTNLAKKNPLLSRKKRYLMFPMNSNFVVSEILIRFSCSQNNARKKYRRFTLNFKAVLGVKIFREVLGAQGFEDVSMQIFFKLAKLEISMAYVKALLVVQPRGINALGECDFPFPLPSDTRLFKKHRRNHHIQRRELLKGLETAFSQGGFNGSACVNRMICEAQHYVATDGKSLVKDILSAIFISSELDSNEKYNQFCHNTNMSECQIPFLTYILNSLFNV